MDDRMKIAAMCLEGLLACPSTVVDRGRAKEVYEVFAQNAVFFADALIAELAKEKP